MKKVAAISGRKRIFRRTGLSAKRIDVNLPTFAFRRKKKMPPQRETFKASLSRAWRGYEGTFLPAVRGPYARVFAPLQRLPGVARH
jgi:hypothetical protein